MVNHTFCRLFLKESRQNALDYFSIEYLRTVWTYKIFGGYEVHFPKCEKLSEGHYWYGQACCAYYARALSYGELVDKFEKEETIK